MNTPNPLYIIINKIIGYIKESNRNKYLTIVFTDEIKDTLKKKRRTVLFDYDEKYIKIKFNPDDDLPLRKR